MAAPCLKSKTLISWSFQGQCQPPFQLNDPRCLLWGCWGCTYSVVRLWVWLGEWLNLTRPVGQVFVGWHRGAGLHISVQVTRIPMYTFQMFRALFLLKEAGGRKQHREKWSGMDYVPKYARPTRTRLFDRTLLQTGPRLSYIRLQCSSCVQYCIVNIDWPITNTTTTVKDERPSIWEINHAVSHKSTLCQED